MKTKDVIYLLNQMHEQVKSILVEEQTKKILSSLPSKCTFVNDVKQNFIKK